MRRTCILVLLVAGIATVSGTAWSQSPAPPAARDTTQPNSSCAPGAGQNAPTVGSGQSNSNLSDKLAQSGGVICPPSSRDSEMAVPPRNDSGRMPVIPPPGTPGGDQSVQPK